MTRSGMTLTEVLVAGLVVAAAMPPLIQLGLTVAKLDTGHGQRTQAIGLSQLVFEQLHYRLYNGDSRGGIKLNDTFAERQQAYTTRRPYLSNFLEMRDDSGSPAVPPDQLDPTQSSFLTGFINGYAGPGRSQPSPITARTNPDLALALKSYKIALGVTPHLDIATVDPAPDAWPRAKERGEPKLDLARFDVRVTWDDAKGQAQTRTLVTRFCRGLYEMDPTKSESGR